MHVCFNNQDIKKIIHGKAYLKASSRKSNDSTEHSLNNLVNSNGTLLIPKIELNNCKICNHNFKTRINLNKHIVEVHELKKPFECNVCHAKFARREQINLHIISVHEKLKLFQCSFCDHKTGSKQNMKSHVNGKHEGLDVEIIFLGDKNHKCYTCGFKTGLKDELSKHIQDVHDGKNSCSICGKHFSAASKLKDHVTVVHEEQKLFQCSICDFKSGFKQSMKFHTNGRHEGLDVDIIYLGDKNHKCYNCDFKTGLKKELENHIHEVHNRKKNSTNKHASESERLNKSLSSELLNESAHERKKEEITKKASLRTVRKEGKKSLVQNFSKNFVHERKKEQITQSLRTVPKEGRKTSNASIEEFIENFDPLEVDHEASVHEESSKKNTQNEPCTPVLFGGINNVKPIELTNICRKINFPSVHEERKPYICYFCNASFLSKEHVKQHISIVHEGK